MVFALDILYQGKQKEKKTLMKNGIIKDSWQYFSTFLSLSTKKKWKKKPEFVRGGRFTDKVLTSLRGSEMMTRSFFPIHCQKIFARELFANHDGLLTTPDNL